VTTVHCWIIQQSIDDYKASEAPSSSPADHKLPNNPHYNSPCVSLLCITAPTANSFLLPTFLHSTQLLSHYPTQNFNQKLYHFQNREVSHTHFYFTSCCSSFWPNTAPLSCSSHHTHQMTESFPCFFLSCKANARVILAKSGHGPHSSVFVLSS
jgi:hypothetical protein